MTRKLVFGALAIVSTVLALSCGSSDIHGTEAHMNCTEWHNALWDEYVVTAIDHNDSRNCPFPYAAESEWAYVGGHIYDTRTHFPNPGDLIALNFRVFDTRLGDVCSNPLSDEQVNSFSFGQPRPGSEDPYDWQASGFANFMTSTSPDHGCFLISINGEFHPAAAIVSVYYGEVE